MEKRLLFVINLEHRKDRLENITNQCKKFDVKFFRINAIKENGTSGPGKSHCKCIDYAIKNNLEEILVCEDDIIFNDNFKDNFDKCYKNLPENWDLFLGGVSYVNSCSNINDELVKVNFFTGLHFVLYRKSSFEKVKNWILLKNRSLTRFGRKTGNLHIDRYLGGLSSSGFLNVYCAKNFLVDTYNCFSDVRKKVVNDDDLFQKAKETVMK